MKTLESGGGSHKINNKGKDLHKTKDRKNENASKHRTVTRLQRVQRKRLA